MQLQFVVADHSLIEFKTVHEGAGHVWPKGTSVLGSRGGGKKKTAVLWPFTHMFSHGCTINAAS